MGAHHAGGSHSELEQCCVATVNVLREQKVIRARLWVPTNHVPMIGAPVMHSPGFLSLSGTYVQYSSIYFIRPNPAPTHQRDGSAYRIPIARRYTIYSAPARSVAPVLSQHVSFLTPDDGILVPSATQVAYITKGRIHDETCYGYTTYVWLHVYSCGSERRVKWDFPS